MAKTNRVIKVTTRNYNYKTLVQRRDPKRRTEPEPAYRFSNGRKFTDKRNPYS